MNRLFYFIGSTSWHFLKMLFTSFFRKRTYDPHGWAKEWKVDSLDRMQSGNIFADFDSFKILDFDSGRVLMDFSKDDNPAQTMAEFMDLLWQLR